MEDEYNLYMTEYEVRTSNYVENISRFWAHKYCSLVVVTAPCYVNWADIGISNFLRLLPISHGGVFAFTSEAEPRRVFLSDIAVSLNNRRDI